MNRANDWMVVIKQVRHHETEQGLVISRWLSEALAKSIRADLLERESLKDWNVWAIREEDWTGLYRSAK